MAKVKGGAGTNIYSKTGKANYDQIKKTCGHKMGEKCGCSTAETIAS